MTTVNITTTPQAAPLGNTPAITSNTTLGRLMHTRIIQRRYPALTAASSSVSGQGVCTLRTLDQFRINLDQKVSRIIAESEAKRSARRAPTISIARQQAIENALSMALYHVRQGDTIQAIRSATAKAIRAASMLKQTCTESANGGRA